LMHVLKRVIFDGECGLILSLRDDIGVSHLAMNRIIEAWDKDSDNEWVRALKEQGRWRHSLDELLTGEVLERFETLYFPPGNITPEEFLHRMLLSILRLRKTGHDLTFVFNGLDQLGPRFPLCAKEPVFVAALLQLLSAQEVTSLFVAASEG